MTGRVACWVLLFTLLLAGCAETPQVTRTPVQLRIGDASDHAALLDHLIDAYARDHRAVTLTNDPLQIQDAINQVRDGQLDLAVIPSLPDQVRASSLWTSGLAYTAIAVVVHRSNPANGLSLAQLRDLYQGRTFDWTPFGGTGDVIPVSREAAASARVLFEGRVMNGRPVTLNAMLEPSAQAMLDFVANTPGAIGYISLDQVDARVKVLSVEGVPPGPMSAASGQYLLSAPIYLITRSEPGGDLREFVAWLLGDDGQALISELGLGRVQ